MIKKIDVLILPPHTSHLTQPLDVGVFGPLKREMGQRSNRFSIYQPGRLARAKWAEELVIARFKAMTSANIKAGWRGSGLVPFNRHKLVQLPSPSPAPQTPPGPSRTPLGPLAAENRQFMENNGNVMTSPIRSRFWEIANGLERAQAENALLEKENKDLRMLVAPSKRRRAGITVPNLGTHHFTTEDVAQTIQEAESSRKSKKGKGKQREAPEDSQRATQYDSFLCSQLGIDLHA